QRIVAANPDALFPLRQRPDLARRCGLRARERRPRPGTSRDETPGGTCYNQAAALIPQQRARVGERRTAVARGERSDRAAVQAIEAAARANPHASLAIDAQARDLIA